MSHASYPPLEEFLASPLEQVASVAPQTMIYSNSGTRRDAALNGIAAKDYPAWSLPRMHAVAEIFFRYGIKHLMWPMLMPSNYNETTPGYRENIERWVAHGLAGDAAIAYWRRQGWRVRMLGAESAPALRDMAARLAAETDRESQQTLWFYVVPSADLQWEWLLAAAARSQARTRSEAIRALYGEDIPPATLFISSGKPLINLDLLPPLLIGELQCYWDQRPGYRLTDQDFRRILYDYAFLRPTWQEDKSDRAASALAHRSAWENGPIIGLGKRLGPFWYPQAIPEEP